MSGEEIDAKRRPLRSRDTPFARWAAGRLAAAGVRPNAISIASVILAAAGGAAVLLAGECPPIGRALLFFAAAACTQLRLLCNLLDGMVAIEGGARTKSGEIYNELPDRFADLLLLVPAGYAADVPFWGPLVGWTAGAFALLTAYVRTLGTSAGARPDFRGPMAKPHRMAALSMGCILSAVSVIRQWPAWRVDWLFVALCVIALGSAITVVRRTVHIVRELESA